MSVLKYARNAAAAAALAALPAHAVAATAPVRVAAPVQQDNQQLEGLSGYIVPIVIVLALGIGLYFALNDQGSPVSS